MLRTLRFLRALWHWFFEPEGQTVSATLEFWFSGTHPVVPILLVA